ncbi:MAG: FtsW/RodA/SpoVE family cell cycle protein [Eubacteriales bacterium]|nr:FtsW/RodA/SpoVE family cell cycle protein [Eubacteriales bacterium]
MNTIINALTSAGQPLMNQLAALFKSNPAVATYYTTIARWVFVGLAVFILLTCIRSLLAGKNPSEIWAYLSLPDGSIKPLSHWENVIGRARSADVVIDIMTVSRNHATLVRDEDGNWMLNDLGSKGGSQVNGSEIFEPTPVYMGDTITLGGAECVLVPPSLKEKRDNIEARKQITNIPSPWFPLLALTLFQVLLGIQLIAAMGRHLPITVLISLFILTVVMWGYCIALRIMRQRAFEMELIAFFLCTLNLAIVATAAPDAILKQLIAILLGIVVFIVLCWYLRDLSRAKGIRHLLMIVSVALFLVNVVFGQSVNGASNWVNLGGYAFQPSELVKVAYIFIGAATLDELYEKKNLTRFMLFSLFCFVCLAIMRDFGTALIFFVTFLIISFLRSGEFSKLILILGVCIVGGLMAIRFIPYISNRFATWGHAWDYPDGGGFQQVRGMSGAASGGLLGLGAGEGWLKHLTYADTDLVFTILSEEWGLIIGLLAIAAIITLGIFAVRSIRAGRSAYYTIAACSATSLFIFQTMLNVLGSLDILPFTGVTLPFISNGGTSMLASWGLLSFLKAADTRQGASFAVKSDTDVISDFAEDYYEEAGPVPDSGYDNGYESDNRGYDTGNDAYRYRTDSNYRKREEDGDQNITDFSQLEDR